ncbi:MAG: bifunctional phosphopantothenoylcysteine decarboxylase/phosphopantothenate--cysteine ligase CoaBC [Bacteroidales bacterium]
MLKGKRILLGVTGSIAAYKSALLIRLLIKEGAEVRVIMSAAAKHFITPLTLATLSKNPISVEFFNPEDGSWNSHVSLAQWADLFIIAPATANIIAKMAAGVGDSLLLTTYLSLEVPLFIAPAMDLNMYLHPATVANIEQLRLRGAHIIDAAGGELASGLEGKGRMEEPEAIVEEVKKTLATKLLFKGKKILITAGPTVEEIDPVRYISNHSSGKMGYALANTLHSMGAEVVLISGPVAIAPPAVESIIEVESAQQMYEATVEQYRLGYHIAIFAAAVADFTPQKVLSQKIKREEEISLKLIPTPDLAAALGREKREGTIHIGFALESDSGVESAKGKLLRKNFDAIVLNSLQEEGAGFKGDTNKITILTAQGGEHPYPLKSKKEVAQDIAHFILKLI